MNTGAEFYVRSLCDKSSIGYSFSGNFSNPSNAADRDLTTYAITSGADTDVWPPTLPANALFEIDLTNAQVVDTIFLRSNMAAFQVYVDNPLGAGDPPDDLVYANYSNTSEMVKIDLRAALAGRTVSKVLIAGFGTIIPNQEKRIIEVDITRRIADLYISGMPTNEQIYARVSTTNLKGGSIQLIPFPSFPKMHTVLDVKNLAALQATYDLIKSYFIIDACLVYLYVSDQIRQLDSGALYLMNDLSDKINSPSANVTVGGVDGTFELLEV